jgi:hypothetical protein
MFAVGIIILVIFLSWELFQTSSLKQKLVTANIVSLEDLI